MVRGATRIVNPRAGWVHSGRPNPDRFIKEQPKLMTAFMRATLKAIRFLRKDREATVNAVVKFTAMNDSRAVT